MAAKKTEPAKTIELTRIVDQVLTIKIVGQTPVIPHKWSDKSKRMMPGHAEKDTVKKTKGARNPKEEAEGCLYYMDDQKKKLGLPAVAFKAAIVGACRYFDAPKMVEAKQMIFVEGDGLEQLVEVKGTKKLREDTPRNSNGSADLRYRYAISNWSATLRVRYVPQLISAESIIALVDAAGRGGVGDWRPSSPKSYTGTYGQWRVKEDG